MSGNKANKELKDWLDHPQRILAGGVVIGVGGWLLYKYGKKIHEAISKSKTEKLLDDSPEVRQASLLRNAMNPSGIPFLMSLDRTNENMIYDTAKQIKNLDEVITAYRKLYGSSLVQDLQNELSSKEYQRFLTLISSTSVKSGGTAPVLYAQKGNLIVAKKNVYIRKTPDASYHGATYEKKSENNIIYEARPGGFIGYATGGQNYDVKNNVKFIQVSYIVIKETEKLPSAFRQYAGKKFIGWVSSSADYIDKFEYYKYMLDKYPDTATDIKYKKPPDFYNGVKGLPGKYVITTKDCIILDSKMQPYLKTESNTILGEYAGMMDTGKGKYVKFRTIDNTERWVDIINIKIV